MVRKPLEHGNVIRAEMYHASRSISGAFFNSERFTEVIRESLTRDIDKKLGACASCGLCTVTHAHETEDGMGTIRFSARASCNHTRETRGHCPLNESSSGYLDYSPEDIHRTLTASVRKETDEDLNEAVEFETREPKYDNFGSW